MTERYTLKVVVPLDENYEAVANYVKTMSYEKIYWHSFAPPHKLEYTFGPISESGVFNMKDDFRDIFKDSKFKFVCKFTTEIYKDDI